MQNIIKRYRNYLYIFQNRLSLQIRASQNGTVRVSIDELQPLKQRYHVSDVLVGEMRYEP